MDQDHSPPPTPTPPRRTTTSSNNPAAAASPGPFAARSPAVRGPTSSAMLLGMSSSPAHSHRRSSPYPPPVPGHLASGSGSSSSSGSPSRFRQQIPPSPRAARGGPSPSPSPVLSELASIRSVGAARATSQQRSEMRAATLYGGRPLHQALPSWSAMYARSRLGTPPPTRSFSGIAPPPSRQLQPPPPPPSTGTLTPQPSRSFSFPGFATSASSQQAQPSSSSGLRPQPGGIPSPAMQQQQAKSSFTDLAPLPGGSAGIFSGFAPPASQQPEAMSSFSDLATTQSAFHGGRPLQQASPSFPTGGFSGFAPSASQQLQPSSSGVPLQPDGTSSGYPSPVMGQPQANSSFTDLPLDLPSGSEIAPAASQQLQEKSSFTTLKPLPSGSFSAGLTPGHGETAMFGSSSWSSSLQLAAPPAASDTTMYENGQQPSSDTVLPPLPPTLQIRPDEVMQFSQPAGNDDSTFSESEAARMQRPPVFKQVKKEPVEIDDIDTQCLHEPQLITVDDNDNDNDEDDDEEISALLNSFRSPNESGSLGLEHTSTEDMLQQHGGGVCSSSSGPSALGAAVEGSGQSWMAMLTPYDTVTTGASSIPWNCYDGSAMSMSQQQIPQQPGDLLFSTGVPDVAPQQYCQPSENNILSLSGFGQQQLQPNLQVPAMLSATDLLQLISMPGPSIWNTAGSSGQGAAAMPNAASADMFGQMSIGGGTMSVGQGWPEAAVAANQYAMFDTSAWAAAVPADQMASKFEQMSMGEGSLSIGHGWPATPAPTFDIPGSSSSAWASMPWNSSSSWTMENYSTPGPMLGVGAMEQPRLTTPRRRPSAAAAGGSRSTPERGAHGEFFSVAEIETIIKDKRLKVMVNTDPERVKRILNNRNSVAKLRPQRRAK